MKIIHHIGLRLDTEEERRAFLKIGVELSTGGNVTSFNIAEDDPRWEKVAVLIGYREHRTFDTVSTKFAQAELESAKFLGMIARSSHGYPQPSDPNGYLSATFNLTDYCTRCGIGKTQSGPFRMKGSPALKPSSILQLNWIFDEYFVVPEVWESVFMPLGIGSRPAVVNRTGAEISSVVQLEIPQAYDLKLDSLGHQACAVCGRKKYPFVCRGFYPGTPLSAASIECFAGFAAPYESQLSARVAQTSREKRNS